MTGTERIEAEANALGAELIRAFEEDIAEVLRRFEQHSAETLLAVSKAYGDETSWTVFPSLRGA
jgi:hypothetical protein